MFRTIRKLYSIPPLSEAEERANEYIHTFSPPLGDIHDVHQLRQMVFDAYAAGYDQGVWDNR